MTNSVRKLPDGKRLKLPDSERIGMIANEMLLLRLFPRHQQANEFRRNLEIFASKVPVLHAAAEIPMREKMAGEYGLLAHPEDCERCAGAGTFDYVGRPRFCGCPAGEKLIASRVVIPDPGPAVSAPVIQMPRCHGLKTIRGLFKSLEEN